MPLFLYLGDDDEKNDTLVKDLKGHVDDFHIGNGVVDIMCPPDEEKGLYEVLRTKFEGLMWM